MRSLVGAIGGGCDVHPDVEADGQARASSNAAVDRASAEREQCMLAAAQGSAGV